MVSLINISIDSPLTMSWWVIKNVLYGSYCLTHYLIYGSKKKLTQEEILLLELKKEISELDKKVDIYYHNDNKEIDKEFIIID